MRFAVIGQGYFAQTAILPAFRYAKGCELTAIFSDDDTKLRTLKRRYGVEHALSYLEYDDFLRSGAVDAVYIALPNDMHADYTVRAARAHVHVLCEKPMAVTADDAERMITACADNRVGLMIAYRLHLDEANMSAVDLIESGRLGEPRFFSSTLSQQVKEGNIRTKRDHGGGPLPDVGIYCINAARYIFRAEPIEVMAFAATLGSARRFSEIDEQVSALLTFPGERLAQFTCSFGAYDHSSYTVVGTKGRMRLDPAYDFSKPLAWEVDVGGRTRRRIFPRRDQVAPELMEMADAIRSGRDPRPSGYEGIADLRVIEAISQSLQLGRRVRVNAVEPRRRPSLRDARRVRGHDIPALIHADAPASD